MCDVVYSCLIVLIVKFLYYFVLFCIIAYCVISGCLYITLCGCLALYGLWCCSLCLCGCFVCFAALVLRVLCCFGCCVLWMFVIA